ncbi:hypothetical protein D3C85_1351870 [compost metagenome]
MAPTGSSIFNFLSINSIENTTVTPQIIPIKKAPTGLTAAQPAVTPTKPANTPFNVIETSGFPYIIQATNIAAKAPAAPAKLVVITIPATAVTLSPDIAN